ncbi:MAG: class I SAM-dependent methyltransferase [Acidobacteriota bacterium]
MEPRSAGRVREFWDAHREKSKDPAYWMAHPLCRQAINRRVSGNPHEWPLDWLRRVHAARPFERGVSWGCGLGAFERAAVRTGLVRKIDAFDVSPASLEDARREAAKEGIEGIDYRIGDFDDPHLDRRRYDVVFFHASLHHVGALERLFRRLTFSLERGGAVYVDEYVGPSRGEWSKERLLRAQAVLDGIPAEAKIRTEIDLPIEMNDPSEAIRSSEIPRFLRDFFDIVEWRPYGGQITDLVMPYLHAAWAASDEGLPYVRRMLEIEEEELARAPEATHYLVAFGRLKSLTRLARPLGDQVRKAVRRRLAGRVR